MIQQAIMSDGDHIDFEVFGEQSSVIDAQIIQVFYNLLRELKLKNLRNRQQRRMKKKHDKSLLSGKRN